VTVLGDGIVVDVTDLTIQNGDASEQEYGFAGGGISCSTFDSSDQSVGDATLSLENVVITGNNADDGGGGLFTLGCDLTVSNSEISYNTGNLMGGLYVIDGNHSFTGVDVIGNSADESGGGGLVWGQAFAETSGGADFDDVIVQGNASGDQFPGFGVAYGTFTWKGTTGSGGSGVWDNHCPGDNTGGLLMEAAVFQAQDVDFGTSADGTDNSPYDVYNFGSNGELAYWAGDDANFTCDEEACGSSTPTTSGSTDLDSWTSVLFGMVISPTGDATLDSFDAYTSLYDGSCATDFYLLSSSTASGGDWDVEWTSTGNTSNSTPDWANSGVVGHPLDNSLVYAAVHTLRDCQQTYFFDSTTGAINVQGLGTVDGYVYGMGVSNTYSEGDTISVSYSNEAYFYQQFNVTEL
jgi:hypothetical protein